MAYVHIGGSTLDVEAYLASLPTYCGGNNYTCRGAGCTWQAGSGGGASVASIGLWCDGKVIVSGNGGFTLYNSNGTVKSSGTGTHTFYPGCKFNFSQNAGQSVSLQWLPL